MLQTKAFASHGSCVHIDRERTGKTDFKFGTNGCTFIGVGTMEQTRVNLVIGEIQFHFLALGFLSRSMG
jgi:hypothetical protein